MLFAYIDAALGSMLLQAMAGMVFAAIVMGRRVIAAPFAWFRLKDPKENPVDSIESVPELSAEL
jgi:hypothetical protein